MGNQNGDINRTSHKPHLHDMIVVINYTPISIQIFLHPFGEEPEFKEEEEAVVTGYATTLRFKLPD